MEIVFDWVGGAGNTCVRVMRTPERRAFSLWVMTPSGSGRVNMDERVVLDAQDRDAVRGLALNLMGDVIPRSLALTPETKTSLICHVMLGLMAAQELLAKEWDALEAANYALDFGEVDRTSAIYYFDPMVGF